MSEPPNQPPESPIAKLFEQIARQTAPEPKDSTIAYLEGEITTLQDKLYEERFIWVLICVVLIDAFIFSKMENWTAPLVIGIFELIGVVILADRCKVNTVMPLIDQITGFVHRAAKTDRERQKD